MITPEAGENPQHKGKNLALTVGWMGRWLILTWVGKRLGHRAVWAAGSMRGGSILNWTNFRVG